MNEIYDLVPSKIEEAVKLIEASLKDLNNEHYGCVSILYNGEVDAYTNKLGDAPTGVYGECESDRPMIILNYIYKYQFDAIGYDAVLNNELIRYYTELVKLKVY